MYRTWENTTCGKLAQREFPYQRMHRDPAPRAPPFVNPDEYTTAHVRQFKTTVPMPPSAASTAYYTVGVKNALGTHTNYSKVSRDELRVSGGVHLGDDQRQWSTEFGSQFATPNQSHATRGAGAPRGGVAPRLPNSEIERNFGSLTSEGTMPGKDGKTQGTSETRAQYANPGRQARPEATLTLGYGNDLGTSSNYQKTPAILADMTHYSLGNEKRNMVTGTMAATLPHAPHSERPRVHPAGQQPPFGPSEVELGFKQQFNSRHFNIVNNGPRLHGRMNTDASLYERNTLAHDKPVGRKQHPCVDPAFRGPTGQRQAYDIITGVDRPRHMW